MPSNFVSYSDFIGANAGQIKTMEERLRAEEQAKLERAKTGLDTAGDAMKKAAFWGEVEGGEPLTSYGDWTKAEGDVAAAKQYQADIQNDAGQLNQLNKIGGGYGNMDAALVFGSNKADSKSPKVSLGEFMGYDAKELEDLAASTESEAQSYAARRAEEMAKKTSQNQAAEQSSRALADWQTKADAAYGEQKKKTYASQMAKRKELGNEFYSSPDWSEWMDYLSGGNSWDRSKEEEYRRRTVGADSQGSYGGWLENMVGQKPQQSQGYSGTADMTRGDWERKNPNKNPWETDFYGSEGGW